MKVIVAGYPKTGTKTLNEALTLLGYKVYDYPENSIDLGKQWMAVLKKGWTTDDFKQMYENVDAVVDMPSCYFWEEIHKAFPDAKIILSMRESEDAWLNSYENQMKVGENNVLFTIMKYLSPTFKSLENDIGYPVSMIAFGMADVRKIANRPYNKELLKLKYRAHNAYVLQNAPSDKLLVYQVKEGWEPLCEFLGVPVPDEPFPYKNKGGAVIKDMESHPIVQKMKREVLRTLIIIFVAIVLFAVALGLGIHYGING